MTSAVAIWIHSVIQLVHERLCRVWVSWSKRRSWCRTRIRGNGFLSSILLLNQAPDGPAQSSVAKASCSDECNWAKKQSSKEPSDSSVTLVSCNGSSEKSARDPYKEEENKQRSQKLSHRLSVTAH